MNSNKERKPINKKLYIALISCVVAAIIAVIAVSLAVGLSRPDDQTGPGNVIDTPSDPDDND